ncbi:hypothetical protein B5T_02261 [Alloalcanivorax dieselolei B5]|uniref:Uncharacterized protein n=1 Tax=Alcanivorax dieselolei (strain DSM 16502 / CGMCC 1.3690 / MCCC 1A00001 / B-5) TaxID=930169 RepID=K0CDM6_ALCDB|nr:hypothetical protein [Alloalcanivorax dieselolei]AFT70535.1 hypothetical protein B5T_02261 [Alloalcanivorax dieselolei B5]GGJ85050.1 hypothetical protein GCM10007426_12700 [Alloalcanivorax dieselolei]
MSWREQGLLYRETVTEEELSAFADGELPRRRARRVAAGIRRQPAYADRVRDYWRRDETLWRALKDDSSAAPLSSPARAPNAAPRRRWLAAAGGLGTLVAAGVMMAVWWQTPPPSPVTAEPAADLTQAIVHAFSNPVALPDSAPAPALPLDRLGLIASGQQPLLVSGQHIQEYRFENTEGQRVALYETGQSRSGDNWLHVLTQSPVTLVRWSQNGRGYVLAADSAPLELAQLALGIHEALSMAGGATPGAAMPSGAPAADAPAANTATARDDISEM